MSTSWIVTAQPNISHMLELAGQRGDSTVVVAVGVAADRFSGADRVVQIELPAAVPVEAVAGFAAEQVAAEPGDVVLAGTSSADRVLAAAVAVQLDAPNLSWSARAGSWQGYCAAVGWCVGADALAFHADRVRVRTWGAI